MSVEKILQEITRIRELAEERRESRARLQGQLDNLLSTVEREFDLDSWEAAERKRDILARRKEALSDQLQIKIEAFKEKYESL